MSRVNTIDQTEGLDSCSFIQDIVRSSRKFRRGLKFEAYLRLRQFSPGSVLVDRGFAATLLRQLRAVEKGYIIEIGPMNSGCKC
jgi:hypothetical protein